MGGQVWAGAGAYDIDIVITQPAHKSMCTGYYHALAGTYILPDTQTLLNPT